VHGGQSCFCFHQVAAVLPFLCNSVWSALPPARWGNSVLNIALCSLRSALGSTTCPTLGDWLVAHSCFQPLCLSQPLVGANGSSGKLACPSTSALSLCCFTSVCSLRVRSLLQLRSLGQVQCFTPHLLVLNYSSLFKLFSSFGRG
jgi:hypothetical protein